MLSDKAEEILELLWNILVEEKRERADVNELGDDRAVEELDRAGYVEIRDNQVNFTVKGRGEACNCVRRHRLAERLFVDVLDMKRKDVHGPSCKFEHILHKGLDENVCILLGHPRTCPHGRPIPEGECCKDVKRMPRKLVMPLCELEVGRHAKVTHLQTKDHNMLKKIIAMGALPNTDIKLIQKFPSYVFQIGKSQFAVDKELASSIYVRMS